MNGTLRILDMFWYQNFISHIRIFRVVELTVVRLCLSLFRKRYFEKRKKKWKIFIGILKNKYIYLK